jgi:hypothetical protein
MDERPKEKPAVVSAEQPSTPVAKFTPFRDEVSVFIEKPLHVTSVLLTFISQSVRGFIPGSCRTYRCLNHENQEG